MLSRILDNKFYIKEKNWGIDLGVSALSRFDRLKQRVTYLAITEIEDCENEAKNLISLVLLSFSSSSSSISSSTLISFFSLTDYINAKSTPAMNIDIQSAQFSRDQGG